MDRLVKAVVIGAGSIGRRHVVALLARDDIERVTVVTSWPGAAENLPVDERIVLTAPGAAFEAEVGIVAVETDRHIDAALPLVTAGIHVLIEKPVSHRREGLTALRDAATDSGAGVFVGYNLRFLPALTALRNAVADGTFGRVLYARFEAGQYLPDWRPGRDYRQTYSASHTRGGGVALDLSHEVDAMRYVLGDPLDWRVSSRHVSALEIDSDDLFEGQYEYESGAVVSVHLDYLAPRRVRAYRVLGDRQEVTLDVANARTVTFSEGGETVLSDRPAFDVPATYPAQLDAFLTAARGVSVTQLATLDDGVRVLELLEARDA